MVDTNQEKHPFNKDNICLIGLMGSGKSTIGPLLSAKLNYHFVDLDKEIAGSLNQSIREIFEEYGEDKFREEEQKQLRRFCHLEKQIIACGGGIVVTPSNLECLRRQHTIYLQASPEILAKRVGEDRERPLLKGAVSISQRLATILREREPLYKECAQIIIATEGQNPEALAEEILKKLPANITQSA